MIGEVLSQRFSRVGTYDDVEVMKRASRAESVDEHIFGWKVGEGLFKQKLDMQVLVETDKNTILNE